MRETEKRIQMYQAQLPYMKERVLAALLLFAFAIAMVTMTTFAWNTLSVAPEVSGATTTLTANGNLEIALAGNYEIIYETDEDGNFILDAQGEKVIKEIVALPPAESAAGDSLLGIQNRNQTWGNLINLSDPSYGLDQVILRPTTLNTDSLAKKPFVSAKYGPDGRLEHDKNADFKYTRYQELANGVWGFGQSDLPGVKAVSSVKVKRLGVTSNLGADYTEALTQKIPDLIAEARGNFRLVVADLDLANNSKSPLSGLMGTYLNGYLMNALSKTSKDPIACSMSDIKAFKTILLSLDAEVVELTGQAYMEIFNLYQLDTYVNKSQYDEKAYVPAEVYIFQKKGDLTEVDDFCDNALTVLETLKSVRASKGMKEIPAELETTIQTYIELRAKLKSCIKTLETQIADTEKETPTANEAKVFWWEIEDHVNNMVKISSAMISSDSSEGKTLSDWFDQLKNDIPSADALIKNDYAQNKILVKEGIIKDLDKILYTGKEGIYISKVEVIVKEDALLAKFGDGKMFAAIELLYLKEKDPSDPTKRIIRVKASARTDAVEFDEKGKPLPSLSTAELTRADATLEKEYVTYQYTAQDTYGLAIDFWIRTNVPASSLILEGEVSFVEEPVFKEVFVNGTDQKVKIYLASIKRTTRKTGFEPEVEDLTNIAVYQYEGVWYYADSSAAVVRTDTIYDDDGKTEIGTIETVLSGDPVEKTNKIATGYSAANRIWDKNDLPLGVDELQYSTSQGSGSCYTFYADPSELNAILDVLELMRVAFVDGNGNLLASAKLDTQYCFSEYGRHLVPLVLYSGGREHTSEDGKDSYRSIMDLQTNEPTLISALVYLEGTAVENKDVLASSNIKGQFNIQFGTTYDEEALKDQDLMKEKILLSADVTDVSPDDKMVIKHVSINVEGGATPQVVQANFIRKISSTQGSLYFTASSDPEKDETRLTKEGNKWVGDFTFLAPGTYVLRSVTVDGQERMLQNSYEFTIEGFRIEHLSSELGTNYTFLTADSYVTDSFTLTVAAGGAFEGKMPGKITGVFTNEDNVNVNLNFTKNTDDNWTASAFFNASGTYTLNYLMLDGEYYELALPFVRNVSLGLNSKVWLTNPNDFIADEEYRYDSMNDIHTYIFSGEHHAFDMHLEIYDERGIEIKQLGGASGITLKYGNLPIFLKWNADKDYYTGAALTVDIPGSYGFKQIDIPLKSAEENKVYYQTITSTISAPTVVAATDNPYAYIGATVPKKEFIVLANPNTAPRVELTFTNANTAEDSLFGEFYVTPANGDEPDSIVLQAKYDSIDSETGRFYFDLPTDTDATYQLKAVKFTNVYDEADDEFYQPKDVKLQEMTTLDTFRGVGKANGFLTITFGEYGDLPEGEIPEVEENALDSIKVIVNIKLGNVSYQNSFGDKSTAFMTQHTIGNVSLTLKDAWGYAVNGLDNVVLSVKHDPNTLGYTIGSSDMETQIKEGKMSSQHFTLNLVGNSEGTYSLNSDQKIWFTGTYNVTLTYDIGTKTGLTFTSSLIKPITVSSALPEVNITAISKTGEHGIDNGNGPFTDTITTPGSGMFPKRTFGTNEAHTTAEPEFKDSKNVTVYIECTHRNVASYSKPGAFWVAPSADPHDYTPSQVTITLSGLGDAAKARLTFATDNSDGIVHIYQTFENGSGWAPDTGGRTDSYEWTSDSALSYYIGKVHGSYSDSDDKAKAGKLTSNTLEITCDLDGDGAKDDILNFAIDTITINNPD